MRLEKDALGEVPVPDNAYFGAQTQRASENFRIGDERFPAEFIHAHALVKKAAARVNRELGLLDDRLARAVVEAADEVIAGRLDGHFPLVIWQSGSGTQTNMNVNEVIANRANELLGATKGAKSPVHPNDHVNLSQSTNDTVPTSMHIAAVTALTGRLQPPLEILEKTLSEKARAYADLVKIGRTHLQDATPLTLGQEFSGYAAQLTLAREALTACLDPLYELPIGGTAVGTGLNAKPGYDRKMTEQLADLTGHPFRPARNKFALMAAHDPIVLCSGALKTLAAALMKIANDLRLLASGPRCGLGELILPANEPGSSIMPGKINPTQCEMLTMVCCRVFGNDAAISLAGSQGHFELNVYKPLLAHALLQSITLLADAVDSFEEKCVRGLEPNRARIAEHLAASLMLVTALTPHLGYDRAAEIALQAHRENQTLKQAALDLGYLTESQFDAWTQPEKMTKPSD